MKYKTAIHIHTRESSQCSEISAKEIVSQYKEKGYHTIIITDHCYEKYFHNKGLAQWKDEIEYLLQGYEKAKKEAELQNINVLLGIELTLNETDSDYLLYGITKDILMKSPYLYNYTLKTLKEWCEENHILLIQAHPYRDKSIQIAKPKEVDGFEVINGSDAEEKNDKAYTYAKNSNCIMLSGDDTHCHEDIGKTNILTRKEIKNIKDFVFYIQNRDYSLFQEGRFFISSEHTENDFKDVWKIEEEYLESDTISSIEQVLKWENKNHDIHIFVKDRLQDCIVGEMTILPLNDEQYSLFIQGKLSDTEITDEQLEKYEDKKEYSLLISAFAIDKKYRNNPNIFYLLLLGLKEKIEELKKRRISFKNICTEGQTLAGRNISNTFLEKQDIVGVEYPLYKVTIDDMDEIVSLIDNYVNRYYYLKVKELI